MMISWTTSSVSSASVSRLIRKYWKDVLVRFGQLLTDYFNADRAQTLGLPSVSCCADQLYLSPNYLGDLVKMENRGTALGYLHYKLIDKAKMRVVDPSKTINDVASELRFKYQQHFTRLFKQRTGLTPNEYRNL